MEEIKMMRFTIDISADLHRKLKIYSAVNKITMRDFIVECIKRLPVQDYQKKDDSSQEKL